MNEYNGHKNYETWALFHFLSNDEPTYNYYRNFVETIPVDKSKEFALADELRDSIRANGIVNTHAPSIYTDLLQSAIDNIDFDSVAKSFIDAL